MEVANSAIQSERLNYSELYEVYEPWFKLDIVPREQIEEFKKHQINETFPVAVLIILHIITFGIFSFIYIGLKHSKLPRIDPDDFSAGKAIGFMFIPLFNIYWHFIFYLKLVDRINFQFKLRGHESNRISKGLIITTLVLSIIPYINFICFLVMFPIMYGNIQSACNQLALEKNTV